MDNLLKLAIGVTKINLSNKKGSVSAFKQNDKVSYLIKGRINGNSFEKIKENKSDVISDFKEGSSQAINLI